VSVESTVFWDVTPCSLVKITEFRRNVLTVRVGLISLWLYKENNKLRDWKKYIYSTYSPLSSTHLWLRCSNFFNPSKKKMFWLCCKPRVDEIGKPRTYQHPYVYSGRRVSQATSNKLLATTKHSALLPLAHIYRRGRNIGIYWTRKGESVIHSLKVARKRKCSCLLWKRTAALRSVVSQANALGTWFGYSQSYQLLWLIHSRVYSVSPAELRDNELRPAETTSFRSPPVHNSWHAYLISGSIIKVNWNSIVK
jgi:hypothetical protein